MTPDIFKILICPFCKEKGLKLTALGKQERGEIHSGVILCEHCQRSYSVIEGIPCLLDEKLMELQQNQWIEKLHQNRKEIERRILDEDLETYKKTFREYTLKEGIDEHLDRFVWEKIMYYDNQEMRTNLGSDKAPKWVIAPKNIRDRNDKIFKWIAEYEDNFMGKQVLNIGPGIDDDLIERLEAKKAEVINCDIILDPLFQVRENNNNRECICSDLMSLPFDDNIFDSVFCFLVLHHINPMEQALSEVMRVLKPSGKIFILEMNPHTLLAFPGKILPKGVKRVIRRTMRRRWAETDQRIFKSSPYEKIYSSKSIISSMKGVGFGSVIRGVALYCAPFIPNPIATLWDKLASYLPLLFDPFALEFIFCGKKPNALDTNQDRL